MKMSEKERINLHSLRTLNIELCRFPNIWSFNLKLMSFEELQILCTFELKYQNNSRPWENTWF